MDKFKIKISSSWFSQDYIVVKYTTNGFFWYKVQTCEHDILKNWYYMVDLVVPFNKAEYFLNKFKTLDDIINYEKIQREKVIEYNNKITEEMINIKKNVMKYTENTPNYYEQNN